VPIICPYGSYVPHTALGITFPSRTSSSRCFALGSRPAWATRYRLEFRRDRDVRDTMSGEA
jgi:hypothetical protein